MERVIISLSGLLFVITWTFLIVLIMQPEETILKAKSHGISKEMLISEKESSNFYVWLDQKQGSSSYRTNEDENIMHLNEFIQFNNGEGVSIDTLLELFDLNEEATPKS